MKYTEKKTYDEIWQAWISIQAMDSRDRVMALKRLGFSIYEHYDEKSVTESELKLYFKIMRKVIVVHPSPQRFSRFQSQLIRSWLKRTGNERVDVISKKNATIPLDSAIISLRGSFEEAAYDLAGDLSNKSLVKHMNGGRALFFSTGSDGDIPVQIRVVDAVEPVLTEKEFKCVVDNTGIVVISVKNGLLLASDLGFIKGGERGTCLDVKLESGNYKACAYHFLVPRKFEGFYMVLCKTDLPAINDIKNLYEF